MSAAANAPARTRLGGVQCLRAVAALLVVASHLRFAEASYFSDPILPDWLNRVGGTGVDLFFVISGFVMVYVTREAFGRGRSAPVFLYNRVTRIYPPLWLFTILISVGAAVLAGTPDWVTWKGFISSMLLIPMYDSPNLGVAWTLIHEMYFYLVFAVFLLGPRRLLPLWLALWSLVVVAAWMTGLWTHHAAPLIDVALNPLTLEFIFGCVVGLLVCASRRSFPLPALLIGAAGFLAACAIMARPETPLAWRALLLGIPGAILLYGVVGMEADRGWRAPRAGVVLGDWSYTLYLSHVLTVTVMGKLWEAVALPSTPVDNLVWIVLATGACLTVAALAYYLYERPVMRLASRFRARLFGETRLPPRPIQPERIW